MISFRIFYILLALVILQNPFLLHANDEVARRMMLELQHVLASGHDSEALENFFLTDQEADSIALYYNLVLKGNNTPKAEDKQYMKDLFLFRTGKARETLRNEYFGEIKQIVVNQTEDDKNGKLHFYRIKATFVRLTGAEVIEVGAIYIHGNLKIVHIGTWPGK